MGLDMYLTKRVYVGGNYEHNKIEGKIEITRQGEALKVDLKKVTSIIEEAGYWRKANAIHKWFVDNVQDGVDNCSEYYVDFSQLEELKSLCEEVLKTKDATKLPPEGGFFFGSTDVDEYYFEDLRETIKIINSLEPGEEYYYRSSW